MILAEKIMQLRKKCGWSQEELADQLGISRQSVSKWESGASIPDLDKIIRMSSLFGVSTDYLLKDELENITYSETDDEVQEVHSVSVEEANGIMDDFKIFAKWLAPAVSACVFSPIPLIVMTGSAEYGVINLSENLVGGLCTGILLLIIAVAVGVMIISGLRVGKYQYLEKDSITLQYGVQGIVQKRKKDFEKTFTVCMAVGVMCCILGIIPLLVVSGIMDGKDGFPVIICVGVLLLMIAIGVWFFVWASVIYGSFQKLLQQGEYTEEHKELSREFDKKMGFIPAVYWCITTAIFLAISLPNDNWDKSWVVWPVAGVLFAALMVGLRAFLASKKREEN